MIQNTNTQINTILHDTNKYSIVDPTNAVVGNTTTNIIVYAFTTELMLLSSLTNPRIRPSRLWQDTPVIEYYGVQARPVSSAYPIYTTRYHPMLCWASTWYELSNNVSMCTCHTQLPCGHSPTPSFCYWQIFSSPCVHVQTGSQVYGITWNFPMG